MAKASLTLRNGTTVTIEGEISEVQRLLEFYDQAAGPRGREKPVRRGRGRDSGTARPEDQETSVPQPHEIANATKECPEAAGIEKYILDARDQLNRVLLPLYVVSQYLDAKYALTMSEISQATRDLGALVQHTNVAKVIRTGGAKFLMVEGGQGRGERRFRISRRGIDRIKSVLKGHPARDGDADRS